MLEVIEEPLQHVTKTQFVLLNCHVRILSVCDHRLTVKLLKFCQDLFVFALSREEIFVLHKGMRLYRDFHYSLAVFHFGFGKERSLFIEE